jgi:hypothetical protein
MKITAFCVAGALLALSTAAASATDIMPNFATAPTGWTVDRYAPDSFGNVGTYQGQSNVLGIGIGPNGATANRPSGQQGGFYSTQGEGYSISGGSGDSLAAALYVPTSWANPTSGARRTDMWGVMTDGTTNVTDYPIIGFTNYGTGTADLNSSGATDSFIGFRVWSDSANNNNGGWYDLSSAPVNYGAWNTLGIVFTGSDYQYYVNGTDVLNLGAASGTSSFSSVLMEAFNFTGDANSPNAVGNSYTAHWANVPEPGSLALFAAALGMLGLVVGLRKRRGAAD